MKKGLQIVPGNIRIFTAKLNYLVKNAVNAGNCADKPSSWKPRHYTLYYSGPPVRSGDAPTQLQYMLEAHNFPLFQGPVVFALDTATEENVLI